MNHHCFTSKNDRSFLKIQSLRKLLLLVTQICHFSSITCHTLGTNLPLFTLEILHIFACCKILCKTTKPLFKGIYYLKCLVRLLNRGVEMITFEVIITWWYLHLMISYQVKITFLSTCYPMAFYQRKREGNTIHICVLFYCCSTKYLHVTKLHTVKKLLNNVVLLCLFEYRCSIRGFFFSI